MKARAAAFPWEGRATAARLALALVLSLSVHAWLVWGLRVVPPRAAGAGTGPLTAWLLPRPVPAEPVPEATEVDAARPEPVPVAPKEVPAPPSESLPRPEPSLPAPEPPQAPPASAGAPEAAPVPQATQAEDPAGAGLAVPQVEDPEFYPARRLDVLPKPVAEVPLRYPEDAAARDVSGTVVLLLKIDELGVVVAAEVVSAEPPGLFEDAARQSFLGALFHPGQRNGRSVKSRLLVEVSFQAQAGSAKTGEDAVGPAGPAPEARPGSEP